MTRNNFEGAAYLWAFFTGEGKGAEQISIAVSKGNDALAWHTLNNGKPLITSQAGEEGLRDPFIIRAHTGNKFYLLATDLKIASRHGQGFHTAQIDGSRYLEIFESTDLVNWSKQRHVSVSSEYSGNTWAPKAIWCNEQQCYVIFWASNLYTTASITSRETITYNRMMYVTTKDFQCFSEPEVWVDVDRGLGKGSIDAVVVEENGCYYRFMKEEESMTIRLDRCSQLLAKVKGDKYPQQSGPLHEWVTLKERVANGLPNGAGRLFTGGEGPCVFRANKGDVNGHSWYLFIDQPSYHGGPNHYIGFASNDLTNSDGWVSVASKLRQNLPENQDGGKPRHGSIISITKTEYEQVRTALVVN
ncbi:Glycosyl hydrolases family 43 [Amphibacillus marinus]|uniref:Glycosyl hydrolases family 43 n=1 Tax=Amphibacillus marinus TaxID=872970 RepID=A0A1H8QB98_9BACI|nr:glycoside hydrolase family 43 protein [Amphibacillus marinus]SEO51492.1 Glycosyl hydrolases family 43 [Amphibacillus marinus]